ARLPVGPLDLDRPDRRKWHGFKLRRASACGRQNREERLMSKLMYALLGAGALVAVASLGSRFVVADTLSGSSSSSSTSSSTSISSTSSSSSGSGPDCSGAAAGLGVIWPPDHTMVAETIMGVTDAFGLPMTITVTGIQQDEPVNALGSGNTAPDGSGLTTSTAYVRAERAGPR